MSDVRAKPLNAKTRESLAIALQTLVDEASYLDDALKKQTLAASLKTHFTTKRDHLVRAGTWIESKLAFKEE